MSIRGLIVVIVTTMAMFVPVADAGAACNTIPDATTLVMRGANRTPEAQEVFDFVTVMTETQLASVRTTRSYKGALGRIDEIYLAVGAAKSVVIEPDGVCVGSPEARPSADAILDGEMDLSGVVVGLLTVSRDHKQSALELFASAAVCDRYSLGKTFEIDSHRMTAHSCESEGLQTQPVTGSHAAIRITLPQYDTHRPPPSINGTTTVAALRSADQLENRFARLAAQGCSAVCSDLIESGGLVCVDKIYFPQVGNSIVYASDPIPCQVQRPVGIGMTNFKVQCQHGAGSSGLATCDDSPTGMDAWEDDCGGIHFPFNWKHIRRDAAGNEIDREVAGYSAISRKERAQPPHALIPGREFIGSTPWNHAGGGGSTDWRFPKIEVDNSRAEEIGLKGPVDKDRSIVHIFPRMPVGVICDTPGLDEACMAVEGRIKHKGIECACEDGHPSPCGCKTISPTKFFACVDPSVLPDSRDGMPCTRHDHCGSNGKCMGQPFCRPQKKIWLPGRRNTGAQKCWRDSTCPGGQQCGYRLFDLSTHVDSVALGSGRIERDATIRPGVGRKQRGVCKDNRTEVCDNKSGNPTKCLNDPPNVKCRGYILEALGPLPQIP